MARGALDPRRGAGRDPRAAARRAAPAHRICAAQRPEALGRRLADTSSQQKLLVSLGQAFGLAKAPRRVEVYDNSHIMGTNAVGAMVVAGANGFMKQHYRTFNMKSEDLKPGDDYGMMREMLQRRFARLVKEEPQQRPDGGWQRRDGTTMRFPGLARSRPHRRRQGAAGGGAPGAGGGRRRRERRRADRHRQGPRPRRRARDLLQAGPAAVQAAAARSGALFRAAPARRGAPLRHRRAPGQAQARAGQEPPRRDRRASARPASGRSCTISAPSRRSSAPPWRI